MPTYDITQITRNRVRYTVTADNIKEAIRKWEDGERHLADDETLEVDEQWIRERESGELVQDEWDDAMEKMLDEQIAALAAKGEPHA